MRIREQEGIDIVREVVAVDDNGYAEPIDFGEIDADIVVLSYQPGTGKTHNTRRFMESHPDSFYFTERHFTINEFKEEWNEQGIEYEHWEGFERLCKNGRAQYLRDKYCVPAYILCRICNQSSDCDYRNQFNDSERILAPVEYLLYPQFRKRDRSDFPSFVFIDEKLSKTNTFKYDKGNILAALRVMERYNEEQRWDEDTGLSQLIENIENDNLPEVNIGDVRGVRTLFSNAVEFALEHENMGDLQTLTKLNLFGLMDYIRWGSIYGFDRTSYSIPFYYYAFDALSRNEDMKLIFLDATFKPAIFQYFVEAYNGEKGFGRDITVQIFDTDLHPQKSHIFRMRPRAWHPKCSFTDHVKETLKWLPNQLNRIRNIFGKSNVGIITFKDLANAIKLMGYENVVHYGDLRSTNAFEEKPVIVVVGTYFPPVIKRDKKGNPKRKDIIRNIWEYFVRDTDSYDIEDTHIGEEWPVQPRRYLDKDTEFREGDDLQIEPIAAVVSMWDDEMYQALHRNRGINHHRIVFAYCWFPEPDDLPYFDRDVHDEFHVKKIFNDQEEGFFDWLESRMATTHIGNRDLVDKILDDIEQGEGDTDIAEHYRINQVYSERNNQGLIRERDVDTGFGLAAKYIRIFRKGIYEKHQPEGINEPYGDVDITEFIEENY